MSEREKEDKWVFFNFIKQQFVKWSLQYRQKPITYFFTLPKGKYWIVHTITHVTQCFVELSCASHRRSGAFFYYYLFDGWKSAGNGWKLIESFFFRAVCHHFFALWKNKSRDKRKSENEIVISVYAGETQL